MQITFQNRKLKILEKICSNFFVSTLFSITFLFEAANTCFLLISVKFAAFLHQMKFL